MENTFKRRILGNTLTKRNHLKYLKDNDIVDVYHPLPDMKGFEGILQIVNINDKPSPIQYLWVRDHNTEMINE